jgi:predicted SAM-dependent methyltransferase
LPEVFRINIGCGQTPTKGWRNFDNSLSVRLASIPLLPKLLGKIGLLDKSQSQFVEFARTNNIEYGNAVRDIPLPSGSVEILYSSHVFEHLDREEAELFIQEAMRLLCPGGIIRLVVPDLKKLVDRYLQSGDANTFVDSTYLCVPHPRAFWEKFRFLLVGHRHHHWMYDGNSLCELLENHGFIDTRIVLPGETMIAEPGELDLNERVVESVFVEARRP